MRDHRVSVRLDARTVMQLQDFATRWQMPLSAVVRAMLRHALHAPELWSAILAQHTPEACEDRRSEAQRHAWERDCQQLMRVNVSALSAANDIDDGTMV